MTSRDSEFLTSNLLATGRGCLPLTMRIQVRKSNGSWKTAPPTQMGGQGLRLLLRQPAHELLCDDQ